MNYGTLATAVRGVGEVMGTWGATPADVEILTGRIRVGRMYIDITRPGEVD